MKSFFNSFGGVMLILFGCLFLYIAFEGYIDRDYGLIFGGLFFGIGKIIYGFYIIKNRKTY